MASMKSHVPSDPAAELAAAEAARQRLTGSLRLPSWFHTSLGAAVAVQVGAAAYGIAEHSGGPMLVLAAGWWSSWPWPSVQVRGSAGSTGSASTG